MPVVREFTWSETDEPHATRRREILKKHPEIAELFGPEPLTLPIVLFMCSIQFYVAYLVRESSWGVIFACAYCIGGFLNHSLQLGNHELSHNLCFSTPALNKILGIIANLPTGIPSSIAFQRYHMEHHQYQGVDGVDVDIPSDFEVKFFTNTFLKAIWLSLQPFFYAIRPYFMKPKKPSTWEFINGVVQFTFNFFFYQYFGAKAFAYLIIGSFLGTGFHPAAGHFIAEHYQFIKGQETYSYYGIMNLINFNVGYHNEHHDFPKVAWSKLAQVKKIAPEYYDNLPCYTSYIKVLYNFLTDNNIGTFSRIKRHRKHLSAATIAGQ